MDSTLLDETINLEKIINEDFQCYKLTSLPKNKYIIKKRTNIFINFTDNFPKKELPKSLKVYFTSEKNSYGIISDKWVDGNVMKTSIANNTHKTLKLNSVQHNNLPCDHESYYECISRTIAGILKRSSIQCGAASLPSYPLCNETMRNNVMDFWPALHESADKCTNNKHRLCVTLDYTEKETSSSQLDHGTYHGTFLFGLSYEISSNSTRIYDEYYIYDGINVVGSVGGTLGMCIGFSFSGLISSLLSILQNTICSNKVKPSNRKLSKSMNGSSNNRQGIEDKGKQIQMANVNGHTRKYVSFEEDVEERLKRLERKMASYSKSSEN